MPHVNIRRWRDLESSADRTRKIAEIDTVFFASSARQSFADEEEKAAFRQRWLGRYLEHFPDLGFVATTPDDEIVGYVIGSLDDPARDPLFADLDFFAHFRDLTPRYPAQLHVNLAAEYRGHGVGARLVDAFIEQARAASAPGVHVVTTRGMRNVGFYFANQFFERGSARFEGRELLFLGRDL